MRHLPSFAVFLLSGLLVGGALAGGLAVDVRDGRYDPGVLEQADPILAEFFAMGRDVGIPVGVWGGPARDYLLTGRPPPPSSDVDLVYDSRELWKALTGDGFTGFFSRSARIVQGYWRIWRKGGFEAIGRYTPLDRREGGGAIGTSIVARINSGGYTISQVGLMNDGSVWNPTGGLEDMEKGLLRYRVPRTIPDMVEGFRSLQDSNPYDVLRGVRFKTQYPQLEWAPGSLERLEEIMSYFQPGSERVEEIAEGQARAGSLWSKLPYSMRYMASWAKGELFGPDLANLHSFVEKGLHKVHQNSQDPAESLALIRHLGLDRMAEAVGLEEPVRELEHTVTSQGAGPGATPAGPVESRGLDRDAYEAVLEALRRGDREGARQALERRGR